MESPNESNPDSISVMIANLDRKSNQSSEILPDWSALNSSVVFFIARYVDTMDGYSAFRRVSQIWRSAAAPSPSVLSSQHPLVVVRLNKNRARLIDCEGLYDIVSHRLHRIEPGALTLSFAHGFLVTKTDRKIKLTNIFTNADICLPWRDRLFGNQFIFSKNPSFSDCLVFYFFPKYSMFHYCRPGDSVWMTHKEKKDDRKVFNDMFFFRRKLYALSEGDFLLVELFPYLKMTNLGGNDTLRKNKRLRWKLAESGGELLLVCLNRLIVCLKAKGQRGFIEDGIIIYVWDFKGKKWEERLSLGERVPFVGYDCAKKPFFAGSIA